MEKRRLPDESAKDVTGGESITQSHDRAREQGMRGERRAVWGGQHVLFMGIVGTGNVPGIRLDSLD